MALSIDEMNTLEKENNKLARDLETRTEELAKATLERDAFYRRLGILKHYVKHHDECVMNRFYERKNECICGLTSALDITVEEACPTCKGCGWFWTDSEDVQPRPTTSCPACKGSRIKIEHYWKCSCGAEEHGKGSACDDLESESLKL